MTAHDGPMTMRTTTAPGRTAPGKAVVAAWLLLVGSLAATGCAAKADGPESASLNLPGSPSTTAAGTLVPAGLVVSCGAGQQALVKQALVNAQPVVQVECTPAVAQLSALSPAGAAAVPVAAGANAFVDPWAAQPQARRTVYREPAYDDEVVYRPRTRTTRVVERRSGRSWQKSAIIIGSSAGVGAGVGAAVGGKKGALIGAAVGGGGAAIWDQITRR